MIAALSRVLLFALVAVVWWVAARTHLPAAGNFAVILGGPLLVFPTVWIARRLLDREPTKEHAKSVTTILHALIVLYDGPAVIKAYVMFSGWRGWTLPPLQPFADIFFLVTTVVMTFTVLNLALRALGAPFALVLSRRLATDWLYRFTRNPMVLASFLWFVAIGIELQSTSFIVWVLLVLLPAELEYLKLYEERELEIRFGKDYLDYKARTPFLWPGRPRQQPAQSISA